jgi:hypothetical protein
MPGIAPEGLRNHPSTLARTASGMSFFSTTVMPPGTARDVMSGAPLAVPDFTHWSTSTRLATVASTMPVSIANSPAPDVRR